MNKNADEIGGKEAIAFANPLLANLRGEWQPINQESHFMPLEDNKFIVNLYHEFEQKLFKVFSFGIEDLKKVLDRANADERYLELN